MSGIGAIWNRDGAPAQQADAARIAHALRFDGPEAQIAVASGEIAFSYAHRTNTPQDRRPDQPLGTAGGRHAMVFDGRLDNRADLEATLGIPAPEAAGLSDAALAARCWTAWGADGVERWVGEFAAIVWDSLDRRLYAIRDPFGRRPLHYHLAPGRVVLASMPRGVHAAPGVERALDWEKVTDLACGMYLHAGQSCFAGVHCVPPGHVLVFGPADERATEYYRLEDRIRPVRYRSDDDYVEAAREIMDRSVRALMRSDGPVGAFMSGGLDSTTGAVMASGRLPANQDRLPVFTAVPEPGWDGRHEAHVFPDESGYARAVAAQNPQLDLTLVDAAGLGVLDQMDAHLAAMEMPFRNVLNTVWTGAILEQAQQRGIRTMLEGAMGNPTLSYRGTDALGQLLCGGRFLRLARELLAENGRSGPRAARSAAGLMFREARGALPAGPRRWLGARPEALPQQSRAVRPEFRRDMDVEGRARRVLKIDPARSDGRERDSWMSILRHHIIPASGNGAAGWTALHGAELRDPFADRRLLEWCFGVPDIQFRRGGEARFLVRRLMKDDLPREVLYKPREIGRQSADWHLRLTRDLPRIRQALSDFAADPDLSSMLDLQHLGAYLDDWPGHTIVDHNDPRMAIPLELPAVLAIGRFVQNVKAGRGAAEDIPASLPAGEAAGTVLAPAGHHISPQ